VSGLETAAGGCSRRFCYYTVLKRQAVRASFSERVHCANVFGIGSGNSSTATKILRVRICRILSRHFLGGGDL
jgi:hypothetical protein